MKIVWCTDIHLDFIDDSTIEKGDPKLQSFAKLILGHAPDAVMITGDISISPQLEHHLNTLENLLQIPILYVLGNHDFYHGSIKDVRDLVVRLNHSSKYLKWVGGFDCVRLTPNVAMVGHDCWYDALNGSWQSSRSSMSDWQLISEFNTLRNIDSIINVARELAKESANHLEASLNSVARDFKTVMIVTHVPPFIEACLQEGKCTIPSNLPWYTCLTVGNLIKRIASSYPQTTFEVYSGHTHGFGTARLAHNLTAYVGRSRYGNPSVQGIISLK